MNLCANCHGELAAGRSQPFCGARCREKLRALGKYFEPGLDDREALQAGLTAAAKANEGWIRPELRADPDDVVALEAQEVASAQVLAQLRAAAIDLVGPPSPPAQLKRHAGPSDSPVLLEQLAEFMRE